LTSVVAINFMHRNRLANSCM